MRQSFKFTPRLRWSAASLGTVLLMVWNARLVLSTGAGLGTMILMYLVQDEQWRSKWQNQSLLSAEVKSQIAQWNRPFVWSAIAGGSAAFFSYLALSAWVETEAHWLATGILLQGLMTFGVLGLVLRQTFTSAPSSTAWVEPAPETGSEFSSTTNLATWVQQLSHPDATARLLAVRELTAIAQAAQNSFDTQTSSEEVLDYLQLFIRQEPEPIVKDAAQQSIQSLAPFSQPSLAPETNLAPRQLVAILESEA